MFYTRPKACYQI